MHFLRSIFERRDSGIGTTPAAWLLEALGGAKTASGQRITPATAEGIPVIYACVGIIADTVGQLPLRLYRRVPTGREPATGHALYTVLHDLANPYMTSQEFRETMTRWLCLWGNAYAEIERNAAGEVVGLWPLASDRMTMERRNGRMVYDYRLRDAQSVTWTITDPNNPPIFHLHINSQDGFTGRSPITILRESLGLSKAADEHAARFFGNGALPDLVLSKKGPGIMKPAARQHFIESWKERFQGTAKSHGIALLEEEFTVTPISMPLKDAQFLELRAFQVEDGARVFRIPLHMLQHTTAVTSWGTGIESMSLGFLTYTMMPWLTRWESAIARDLLTKKSFVTHFAKFGVQGLLRGDAASRGDYYTKMVSAGALSPNEVRALEELNGIGEDGDEYFISANVKPLDTPEALRPSAAPPGMVAPDEDEDEEADGSDDGDSGTGSDD